LRLAEFVQALGGSAPPLAGGGPQIAGVHLDSRRVGAGDLFAALPGTRDDGARFAVDAVARGASAILAPHPMDVAAPVWVHPDARRIAGEAAALAYGEPSSSMFVVGVTGTNGKTTTAHLVGHLLRSAGRRPAVLGTTGNRLADGKLIAATHTTPDAPALQRLLVAHRELGGDSVALEASSHALDQERTAGVAFDVAIFTNLTRDHLDFHGTMEEYYEAKRLLFSMRKPGGVAVVNVDDLYGRRLLAEIPPPFASFSPSGAENADFRAEEIRCDLGGTRFDVVHAGGRFAVASPLLGRFQVGNVLGAAAAGIGLGVPESDVAAAIAGVANVPGRLERVEAGQAYPILVDYAHTPDALERLLSSVRELTDKRIILVFGCGGDRDRGKRAPMGEIAGRRADIAIATSDNPRSEDPEAILREVEEGLARSGATKYLKIVERRDAIRAAVELANPGSVVVIAGKGHETTQSIRGQELPFDDRKVAAELAGASVRANADGSQARGKS